MNRINSWKTNNQAYKISENVKALQKLSEQANLYLGVVFFASGVKALKGALQLNKSVSKLMGKTYKTVDEVTVPIKNTELLNKLNSSSKGDWVKVYEAGLKNGSKVEIHYFRNNTTGQVFDVKTKYNYWHQKAFKKL